MRLTRVTRKMAKYPTFVTRPLGWQFRMYSKLRVIQIELDFYESGSSMFFRSRSRAKSGLGGREDIHLRTQAAEDYSKLREIRIQSDLENNSDYAKIRITWRKMH